jgi:uncharacterized RDD family membrane protein YckC
MVRAKPRHGTRPASIISRAIAFLVDGFVVGTATALLFGGALLIAPRSLWVAGMVSGVGTVGYFVYLEGTAGQTIGKRLMGIAVVGPDGGPSGLAAAAVRNVLRVLDSLPTFYLLGLLLMFLTEDRKRLGDLVGNTMVVAKTA